jgi:hypothetical protein
MKFSRSLFLTIGSAVAVAVGAFAYAAPQALLESKGVSLPNAAATLWVREVGITILGLGVSLGLVRQHASSPTLRAQLIGNAVVQLGLLPVEIDGYRDGVITRLSGIIPNTVLHLLLAVGFLVFAVFMRPAPADER